VFGGRNPESVCVNCPVPGSIEVKRQVTPPAADVEHLQAGLQVELGGDQAQLVELGTLQAVGVIEEVGARVLHALVEKQGVEVVAEIVVMGNVLACLADWIGLLDGPTRPGDTAQHLLQGIAAERHPVDGEQCQEVAQRRVLERQAAVHIGLARVQLRIEEQLGIQRAVAKAHCHARAVRATGEDMLAAVGVYDLQRADAHERFQHVR